MIWGLPFGGSLGSLRGLSAKKGTNIYFLFFSEHFANIVFFGYLSFNFLINYLFL